MFPAKAVTLHGNVTTFQYQSNLGSTVTKAFCPNCGSPIYGKNTRSPNHLTLALGCFENADDLSIEVVVFERDRPHWDRLEETVAVFETQPDWTPDT